VLLAVLALTLALAGCGGDESGDKNADPETTAVVEEAAPDSTDNAAAATTDEAAKASTSDACQLLDNDAITSITGVDFSKAVPTATADGCDWDLSDVGGMSMVSVLVDTSGVTDFTVTRGVAAGMFDDVTDVSVDGAKAAFTYMGGVIVAMDIKSSIVQVMFISFEGEATDDSTIVKLAQKVADNM
jgi:hypothetical protein